MDCWFCRVSATFTAPSTTFAITPTVSRPATIWMVTRTRASCVTGVMSPKPTVAKTVTVKYSPSVRSSGSLNASGCWVATVQ